MNVVQKIEMSRSTKNNKFSPICSRWQIFCTEDRKILSSTEDSKYFGPLQLMSTEYRKYYYLLQAASRLLSTEDSIVWRRKQILYRRWEILLSTEDS